MDGMGYLHAFHLAVMVHHCHRSLVTWTPCLAEVPRQVPRARQTKPSLQAFSWVVSQVSGNKARAEANMDVLKSSREG